VTVIKKVLKRPEFVIFLLLSIFLLPLCGLIFQCGCTHLWAGADSHCNIHVKGQPDCPWCISPFHNPTLSFIVQMLPFVLIFTAICIFSHFSRSIIGKNYFKQLAVGIVGGLIIMFAVASIYGWIYDYPF
jgi:hypothetical protein